MKHVNCHTKHAKQKNIMGDRANIKIKEINGNNIYVYTHWSGSEWPKLLQEALTTAKSRWDDPAYLQRVIITEMCKGATDVTGYGVSSSRDDNEHDVMEVDVKEQKVRKLAAKGWDNPNWEASPVVIEEWSFEEYCQAQIQ